MVHVQCILEGGVRNPGVNEVGSLWEVEEERTGSRILKVVGTGRNTCRKKCCNIG